MRQLACRDDVESRLILARQRLQLDHGPFRKAISSACRKPSGPAGAVAQSFSARSDALRHASISFRTPPRHFDASTPCPRQRGPHFDSYDVFLLQGQGHRRWPDRQQAI